MSVSATEAVTPSGMYQSPTATGSSSDKDMFLNLMVAQLRYQDPMNPTDSGQFLSQNAQFTALEKMQDVADQTAALLNANSTNSNANGYSASANYAASATSPNTTTAPVACIDEKETHCSIRFLQSVRFAWIARLHWWRPSCLVCRVGPGTDPPCRDKPAGLD